jgi:4-hydroxy-2-oxoheptanedioate aldolase
MADPLEYLHHANHETFLMLQIEDAEAVDHVDEIAAVEGVDLLFVGPGDLSLSYGVPMQTDHPAIQQATERVANAAAKHGKWWGIATGNTLSSQRAVDMGASLITCGSDHSWLLQGVRKSYQDSLQVHRPALALNTDL